MSNAQLTVKQEDDKDQRRLQKELPDELFVWLSDLNKLEIYFKNAKFETSNQKKLIKYAFEYCKIADEIGTKFPTISVQVFQKYRLCRRLCSLILGPIFHSFRDQKGILEKLAYKAIQTIKILDEMEPFLFVLFNFVTVDSEMYNLATKQLVNNPEFLQSFEIANSFTRLALKLKNPLDCLFVLLSTKQPGARLSSQISSSIIEDVQEPLINCILSLDNERSDFTRWLSSYLSKFKAFNEIEQFETAFKLAVITYLGDDLIVCFSINLAHEMLKFKMQKTLILLLLYACFESSVKAAIFLDKTPVTVWSNLCAFLNSCPKTNANKADLHLACDLGGFFSMSFEESAFTTKLMNKSPGLLSAIKQTTNSLKQYINFDSKISLFCLGTAFIPQEAELVAQSFNSQGPVANKQDLTQLIDDCDVLKTRRHILSSHDSKYTTVSDDLKELDLSKVIFVVDTNILISRPDFFSQFSTVSASFTIPVIVLEELVSLLDNPVSNKAANAKRALEFLGSFRPPKGLNISSMLANGTFLTHFDTRAEFLNLGKHTNDDIILQSCLNMLGSSNSSKSKPIIVSDDVNMRLKGKAMGLKLLTMRELFRVLG